MRGRGKWGEGRDCETKVRFIKCRCTCCQLPRSHSIKFSRHRFCLRLVSVV